MKIIFLYAFFALSSVFSAELQHDNNKSSIQGIINDGNQYKSTDAITNNVSVAREISPAKAKETILDITPQTAEKPNTITARAISPTDQPIDLAKTTKATTTTSTTSSTTSATTSSTTTPTTSTPAPTTSTSAPTTPAPKPKPYPHPSIGKWNSSCIMIQMAAQLNFTYLTRDSNSTSVLYNIPVDAKVEDSDCTKSNSQSILLNWGKTTEYNTLSIIFAKNESNFYLFSMNVIIQIEGDEFPNAKENQTVHLIYPGHTFRTPIKMSYHCTREQTLNLTKSFDDLTTVGVVSMADIQLEAFRSANQTKFSMAKDCDATDTPDIIPIAVGIALILLILVVLISYLVARRRSTARGYMSF